MGYVVREFESTPNPTAVKCNLDRPIAESPRSYFNAEAAATDPTARALFEIPGVRNLLFCADWVTVNTHPGTDWRKTKAAIKRILAEAP
jgi:hypothetical protein